VLASLRRSGFAAERLVTNGIFSEYRAVLRQRGASFDSAKHQRRVVAAESK
jgi:hypothetical protein